jgi:hypothetical protein
VRASELLGIDVVAELRTLCGEQLQGSWQIPAELVRLALARGATGVRFDGLRRGFTMTCEGDTVTSHELLGLATALDGDSELDRRHAAIVRLETGGAQVLLWMAGAAGASLQVVAVGEGRRTTVSHRPGAPLSFNGETTVDDSPRLVVRFTCPRFDWRRAAEWLRRATRFAPIPVQVDASDPPKAFAHGLFEVPVERPVPARLAITWSGDAPQLWLLRHGVLATRATVPGYPAFEAAVELGDVVPSSATPGDLRSAVNPFLSELIDQGVRLMIFAADRLTEADETVRERVTCLLLRAARRGLRRDEIMRLPILPVSGGVSEDVGWVTVREAGKMAHRDKGVLMSDSPDRVRSRATGSGKPVLVLSTEMRGLLADLLEVRAEQLPRRERRLSLQRAVIGLRAALRWLGQIALRPIGRRIVPADELLDPERELLAQLNRHVVAPAHVRICVGGGGIRRRGRRLLLPRHNPLVVQAARLSADDERWVYPAVLALLGDRAEATDELRARWLRRCLGGGS